jgi:hypothetical protein
MTCRARRAGCPRSFPHAGSPTPSPGAGESSSPEDLLPYKLAAYRIKDRAAVDRLLAVQSALDWSYVRQWAARLGVTARLEESLRSAGLDEGSA